MMSATPAAAAHALALFEPPYNRLTPCGPEIVQELTDVDLWKGCALVWVLNEQNSSMTYFEALRCKAPGLPLIVLLPPPTEIRHVLDMMPVVRGLAPRMILPHGLVDTPNRLRQVLALPPRNVAATLTDYLVRRGLLRKRKAVREFQKIVELAPETRSITALSRRMYTSRRTLGRHFLSSGMPVPSHCLHFARLLYVAVHLQADEAAMFRTATRFGYSDGFTMSNQMKRLTGHRPSQVRELLGWEWLVEVWLKKEGV
jgi:AraC-like DNA-binding protein